MDNSERYFVYERKGKQGWVSERCREEGWGGESKGDDMRLWCVCVSLCVYVCVCVLVS